MNDSQAAAELHMSVAEFQEMLAYFEEQAMHEACTADAEETDAVVNLAVRPAGATLDARRPPPALKYKRLPKGRVGPPMAIGENLLQILMHSQEWHGVLAYNELDCNVIKIKAPPFATWGIARCGLWTDNDTTITQAAISSKYNVEFPRSEIDACILAAAERQSYHPIRTSIRKLAWDGNKRLCTWLQDYLGAKDCSYTRAIGPKVLIGMVARIMQPGCKLDTMPILEGAQGIRKSSILKVLAGKEEWFSDTAITIGDKDSYQALRGAWVIEFGELAAVLKRGGARLETAKAYLTASVDRYRPSYGRRVQSFERQCMFFGTTNEHDYLRDPTGNRRFWPIACGMIDLEQLAKDRDQLIAEALVYYDAGQAWHLSESEQAEATKEQAQRNEEDPWESSVLDYLEAAGEWVTVATILADAVRLPEDRAKPQDQQRIGGILRRAGWKPRGNFRPNRWIRVNEKKKVEA